MPAASRRLTGKTSNPTDDAAAWMTPNWAIAEGLAGSRSTAARLTLGATCLSSSGHFPLKLYSNERKPVALPPGRAKFSTRPAATGSDAVGHTIGTVRVSCNNGPTVEMPVATMAFGRIFARFLRVEFGPPRFDPNVATDDPAQLLQLLQERTDANLIFRIIRGCRLDDADPHALSLLRAYRERPRGCRAAKRG